MKIIDLLNILRFFGPIPLLHWGIHQIKRRSGWLELQTPVKKWSSLSLADVVKNNNLTTSGNYKTYRSRLAANFFFPHGKLPQPSLLAKIIGPSYCQRTIDMADACCKGEFIYFSDRYGELGYSPDWHLNPFSGAHTSQKKHWSRGTNFTQDIGDIKIIWEPSRFSWVYTLVRAYALSGDERYPRRYWELLESWLQANPPQAGYNWQSGQETALRAMAICFGFWAFLDSAASSEKRVEMIPVVLSEHAKRVEVFIGHAIRQKNNHALSEACGLWTIGLLFPELKGALRWRHLGRRVLEQELERQVYSDGSYVQHSMNYHRVMLQVMTWAVQLGQLNGQPFARPILNNLKNAAHFLNAMMDQRTGQVPNYGANDGARVLPLDACDYTDFRPAVQIAVFAADGHCPLQAGPWDESLVWLFGMGTLSSLRSCSTQISKCFDAGGYYTLRSSESWCMTRCHTYQDRPSHCDPLHVDMWWRGINILRDSGTFSYYCPKDPEFCNYFSSIKAHNTIEIDDSAPMRAVSRFIQVPWPSGKTIRHQGDYWQGEHYGYARAPWHVIHRRSIEKGKDGNWRIIDQLLGKNHHKATLRWHLPWGQWCWVEDERRLTMSFDQGAVTIKLLSPESSTAKLIIGHSYKPEPPAVESRYYGRAEPQCVLELSWETDLPTQTTTIIQFEGEI
ncbi:MAG: alginate lyase family protein [Candidatus Hodarchaeota archaeon]